MKLALLLCLTLSGCAGLLTPRMDPHDIVYSMAYCTDEYMDSIAAQVGAYGLTGKDVTTMTLSERIIYQDIKSKLWATRLLCQTKR